MKIINNFLNNEKLFQINNILFIKNFFWNTDLKQDYLQFNHVIFDKKENIESPFFNVVMDELINKLNINDLLKSNIVLVPNHGQNITKNISPFLIDPARVFSRSLLILNTSNCSFKFNSNYTLDFRENTLATFSANHAFKLINGTNKNSSIFLDMVYRT